MELKYKKFDDGVKLAEFVKDNEIKKTQIQAIVHDKNFAYLYWWG